MTHNHHQSLTIDRPTDGLVGTNFRRPPDSRGLLFGGLGIMLFSTRVLVQSTVQQGPISPVGLRAESNGAAVSLRWRDMILLDTTSPKVGVTYDCSPRVHYLDPAQDRAWLG